MKVKNQVLLIAMMVVLVVFFYVWPGVWRYKYERTTTRTDRLTGQIQEWKQTGQEFTVDLTTYRSSRPHWHQESGCPYCKVTETRQEAEKRIQREEEARIQREKENRAPEEQDLEFTSKITGRAGMRETFGGNVEWSASIYNGSDWRLTELTVELNCKGLKREYRVPCHIGPKASGMCSAEVDTDVLIKLRECNKTYPDWNILSAKGYPPPGYDKESNSGGIDLNMLESFDSGSVAAGGIDLNVLKSFDPVTPKPPAATSPRFAQGGDAYKRVSSYVNQNPKSTLKEVQAKVPDYNPQAVEDVYKDAHNNIQR